MSQVELRPAVGSDSDFAYQAKRAAFKTHFEATAPWVEEEQRRLHDRRFLEQDYFIVLHRGAPAGMVALTSDRNQLHVKQLFLLPEFQGRGLGRATMSHVLDRALREERTVHLRSLRTNLRAVSFFKELGFSQVSSSATHHHFALDPRGTSPGDPSGPFATTAEFGVEDTFKVEGGGS